MKLLCGFPSTVIGHTKMQIKKLITNFAVGLIIIIGICSPILMGDAFILFGEGKYAWGILLVAVLGGVSFAWYKLNGTRK